MGNFGLGRLDAMNTSTGYTCMVTASGNPDFYRGVAVPFAEAIEELLATRKGEIHAPVKMSAVIRNDATSFILLGITIFVAKYFTKNVLEDFYANTIQPHLESQLLKIESKVSRNRLKKSFNISLWYAEYDALVSVTVIGNSIADVAEQLHLIPGVHENALFRVTANGTQDKIHHYTIVGGKVNAVPLLAH